MDGLGELGRCFGLEWGILSYFFFRPFFFSSSSSSWIDWLIDLLGIQERKKGWVFVYFVLFPSIYIGNQAFQREYGKEKFAGLGLGLGVVYAF